MDCLRLIRPYLYAKLCGVHVVDTSEDPILPMFLIKFLDFHGICASLYLSSPARLPSKLLFALGKNPTAARF